MHQSSVRMTVRPSVRRWLFAAATAATLGLVWSSSASAQQAADTELADSARTVHVAVTSDISASTLIAAPSANVETSPVGPVLTSGLVRYVPSASQHLDAPERERMQRGPNLGRNVALVIVGVAAMIIGSDIGDTSGSLLVAGGAGMTLYGLYYILK